MIISNLISGCGDGFEAIGSPNGRFTATPCCAPGPIGSPRSDLLDNKGFESGLAGWEDWGSSSVTYSAFHSGGAALRITGNGGRGQEVIYRLKTGATYSLKAFARSLSSTDIVYLGVKFFDQGNNTMGDERVRITSPSYSEYSVRFKIPVSVSSTKIYAYKENAGSSPADFDDFSLTMVDAPVNPPMENSIPNPSNLQPLGPAGGWTLVFNDDFNGSVLNGSLWNSGFWFNYTINNELQAYRPENVKVGTGTMKLLAENRATATTWGDPMNYASGAVTTRNKFTFTFGVAQARIKVPRGRGFYPQFWMLPNMKRSPPEIDIMQVLGQDPTYVRMNYFWMDDNGIPHAQPMGTARADFAAGYHTFTLQWLPDSLTYYVDGVVAGTYVGNFVLRDPAYLILNLAIGGDMPGSPDGSTVFPQGLDVDYVRVWQKPL